MNPRVTVITTVFDRPQYLAVALDSLRRQTFNAFEAIVSDDGDSVAVRRMVETLRDSRFRYRSNPQPLGILANKVAAASEARGEYVAILDDDDAWSPTFLARTVAVLDANPDVNICFSDHYLIDAEGNVDAIRTEDNSRRWGRSGLQSGRHQPCWRIGLIDQSICSVQAAVLRASALDWATIPPDVGPLYDQWLTYMCAREGGAAFYIPERLTYYRSHTIQYSHARRVEMSRASVTCWSRLSTERELTEISSGLRRKLHGAQLDLGLALLHDHQVGEARAALWSAGPALVSLRGFVALCLSWALPQSLATWAAHQVRAARAAIRARRRPAWPAREPRRM